MKAGTLICVFSFIRKCEKCLKQQLTLTLTLKRSLTQVVGPAVPGLVLVGESGIEGSSAIVLEFGLNVLSHCPLCQEKDRSQHSGVCRPILTPD